MTSPERFDPQEIHFEFGTSKVHYETEAGMNMNEKRARVLHDAIVAVKEPESLQLGKMLKQSHITMSHIKDKEVARSEAKNRFVGAKAETSAAEDAARLKVANDPKACHIDLSVGCSRSSKAWSSNLKATHGANENEKFACKQPEGFQFLGEELRKSNVTLHAGRHDFRTRSLPTNRSESNLQYGKAPPMSQTVGFADTLGKALRTSSIDAAFGSLNPAPTQGWHSQQHVIMAQHSDQKWNCRVPDGFAHLKKELQKTNVTLGTDRVDYGTRGLARPIRDDRKARPAGADRGL